MKTFSELFHCSGCTDQVRYQRNISTLALAKAALDLLVMSIITDVDTGTVALAWFNPLLLIDPWMSGDMPWGICATTVVFFYGLIRNTVHRLRDAGIARWWGLLVCVPFVGPAVVLVCCFLPRKKHCVWDLV